MITSGSGDRKSTRLNSSHRVISYAVFCLKKKSVEQARAEQTECVFAERPQAQRSFRRILNLSRLYAPDRARARHNHEERNHAGHEAADDHLDEIGRASCRERV